MAFDSVIAYTYKAELLCPACVIDALRAQGHLAHLRARTSIGVEQLLNDEAQRWDLDRDDEHTFDSDDFPKTVLAISANDGRWDHCDNCGVHIGHDERDCAPQRFTDQWHRDPALSAGVLDLVQDTVIQDPEVSRDELGTLVLDHVQEFVMIDADLYNQAQEVGELAHETAVNEGVFR